jgi:two-component system, NarL family, sensor histidine kinase UhpB
VAVFRVAQEALLNVHKHARARRVDVHLEERDGALVLEVTDDGVGVPADALTAGRGAGLRGLRDRADLLGGTLEIGRRESGGTRLVLRLPAADVRSVA